MKRQIKVAFLFLVANLIPLIVLAQRGGPAYLLVQHGDGVQNDFTNDLIEDVIP